MNSKQIHIFDTTLRDGEQGPGGKLNVQQKIEIAKVLDELKVDVIEAGFPASSPGDFNSVKEISKTVRNSTICALTRANFKDIDIAAEALSYAERKRIHTGIGVSEIHMKHKFNMNKTDILNKTSSAVRYAKNLVDEVEFYAEDAGRSNPEFLCKVVETAIDAGATVINIPDTTGYCLPEMYGSLIKTLFNRVNNIHKAIISVHCHNDLGLATSNSLYGLLNGARQVECTINGIGERAGNTALEEITMILKSHNVDGYFTNIDTTKLYKASQLVSTLTGMNVQPNKAIVGKNAFVHSSGIHQDGFLKNKSTYEIMDPATVGVTNSEIILTARSGRAALKHKFEKLGFSFSKEEIDGIYPYFLTIADEKKVVTEDDLLTMLQQINACV